MDGVVRRVMHRTLTLETCVLQRLKIYLFLKLCYVSQCVNYVTYMNCVRESMKFDRTQGSFFLFLKLTK